MQRETSLHPPGHLHRQIRKQEFGGKKTVLKTLKEFNLTSGGGTYTEMVRLYESTQSSILKNELLGGVKNSVGNKLHSSLSHSSSLYMVRALTGEPDSSQTYLTMKSFCQEAFQRLTVERNELQETWFRVRLLPRQRAQSRTAERSWENHPKRASQMSLGSPQPREPGDHSKRKMFNHKEICAEKRHEN